ncbi:LlaJI family restriction endonuclease [Thalassotalea litorea]|uniref:LlaJI family restriction endonuclease n=1 Tax=Thalassotalea litorea TaxID=2020715 RepID=A0A5R9IMK4_9GAMM|nr:LlaJI family restriction endonuclease [Thalassotalea litorea]TLU65297.1 LlaJI family restriction endonuclease [Thalassotalea litorea]
MSLVNIQVDGCVFRCEDLFAEEQIANLTSNNLLKSACSDNKYKVKTTFVGCIEVGDTLLISLPYGITSKQLNTNYPHQFKSLVVKVIKSIKHFSHHYLGKNEIVQSGKLSAALLILEDYELNGILTKYNKQNFVRDKGKINWNNTLKKSQPYKLSNSWIYKDYYRKTSMKHDNHELTLIHNWAIHESLNLVEFISDEFNYDKDDFESHLTKSEVNEIVFKLYPKTTKDRELYVLDLISQLSNEKEQYSISAIYTKNFNLIWEKALQFTLGHDSTLREDIPKVNWNDCKKITEKLEIKPKNEGGAPEVDIIFKNNDQLHVLDAKYYDLFNAGTRPGLTDLWKQFYYGQAYQAIYNLDMLPKNGFIFPYFTLLNENSFRIFSEVLYSVEKESGASKELTKIPAFVASISDVLEAYLSDKNLIDDYLNASIQS